MAIILHSTASGKKKLNLSSWSQYDLSQTISGLFVNVVAGADRSYVRQNTANSRIDVGLSNNGASNGFLTRFPISDGLALHFASSSTVWSSTVNFNNWFGCGFDDRNFTATVNAINPFRFGWANNHAWSDMGMFFANGGWMVADGNECYFLDDDYNITAHITLDTAPTNFWISDQKSDTGSATLYLYIDEIRYK